MINADRRVTDWLQGLPPNQQPHTTHTTQEGRRRERASSLAQPLASPPMSSGTRGPDGADTPPKKRRLDTTRDETPPQLVTPKKRRIDTSVAEQAARSSMHSYALSGTSTRSSSLASGVSSADSPEKHLPRLRHSAVSSVRIRSLHPDRPPVPAATDLLLDMQEINRCHHILPQGRRGPILARLKERNLNHRRWEHAFLPGEKVTDEHEELPGTIPPFETAERIANKARECWADRHEEFGWNAKVHLPLLESVLEDAQGLAGAFGVMSCLSARPHPAFRVTASPAKLVDLCIYATYAGRGDGAVSARIRQFCRESPTETVNHTDYTPTDTRPMTLAIAEATDGEWTSAQLRVGVWHAAQWAFLRWAVMRRLSRRHEGEEMEAKETETEETEARETEAEGDGGETEAPEAGERVEGEMREALDRLGFLPAAIIEGHTWHLVLSTFDPDGGRTRLWTRLPFGDTQRGVLGVYGVVAGVRRLTAWTRDVYLPWFEEHVLGTLD